MNVLKTSDKERKSDRILVLKKIEGQKTLTAMGTVDPRVLTGGNRLHAIRDERNSLWYFKWDHGNLSEVMKQKFTSFDVIYRFAEQYFKKRGVEIEKVED